MWGYAFGLEAAIAARQRRSASGSGDAPRRSHLAVQRALRGVARHLLPREDAAPQGGEALVGIAGGRRRSRGASGSE